MSNPTAVAYPETCVICKLNVRLVNRYRGIMKRFEMATTSKGINTYYRAKFRVEEEESAHRRHLHLEHRSKGTHAATSLEVA